MSKRMDEKSNFTWDDAKAPGRKVYELLCKMSK